MAEDQVDALTVAEQAARLNDLAVHRSAQGQRDEALAAAEEAARLYHALTERFPVLFGTDAERADALATALREDRPGVSSLAPTPAGSGPTGPGASTLGTVRIPDEPGAGATPGPEPPARPAPAAGRPCRSRRRTVLSAALMAAAMTVLIGTVGSADQALPQVRTPAPVREDPPPAPVPPPVPVLSWTATARPDVAPTGVTLRSTPSTAGDPVGRLPAGADAPIQCGEIGRTTSTETGESSSSWLRTTAGGYLSAVNVEVRGPDPVRNCTPGQPPVPLPHHR
ncbi:hypothetical protein [Pseudonocardia parietis]|uniref:Ig-like domain-containing protein n=1 Tax=Pseudonocardia parietis TaxID=570936 RepID=A0ABS4W060_9PSEU|nr:hypothetical protein [Pseudonocardia parietis]MBP2369570.1 hypothetical protein [Pseudonocardia parietis]